MSDNSWMRQIDERVYDHERRITILELPQKKKEQKPLWTENRSTVTAVTLIIALLIVNFFPTEKIDSLACLVSAMRGIQCAG